MKLTDDGYYGLIEMPFDKFNQLDKSMFISHCTDTVKFMCANPEEKEHLRELGVDLGDCCCDWFKLKLIINGEQ